MKRILTLLAATAMLASCGTTSPKTGATSGPVLKHASEDIKIGMAGATLPRLGLDETLAALNKVGVKYFSVKDWLLPLDSTKEQMDAFKAKCAEHGVEGYILGPLYMKSKEQVDKTFAYAQRYGVKMFIGVPDYELIDYVIAKVKETGIRVAIHTHGPDGAAFPDVRTIVEMVKDPSLGVGCCMDLGHTFRMGWDVAADIHTYKDWIYDIHIKDINEPSKQGSGVEVGRGQMDIPALIKALKDIGYEGVISLEYEKREKDRIPGIAESVGYIRGVIDGMKYVQ